MTTPAGQFTGTQATPPVPAPAEAVLTEARPRQASDPPDSVVVVLAQLAPRLGDVATNLEQHLAILGEAQRGGGHLVVFPELSLTGYFLKDLVPDVALRLSSAELATLADACKGIDAVVGCVLETEDARFHNVAIYLSGGRIQHIHRKVYLPTYGLFDELRYLAPGDGFRTFSAPLAAAHVRRAWSAGILICEDMWHPSATAILARQGLEVLFCPSSSPGAAGVPSRRGDGCAITSLNPMPTCSSPCSTAWASTRRVSGRAPGRSPASTGRWAPCRA